MLLNGVGVRFSQDRVPKTALTRGFHRIVTLIKKHIGLCGVIYRLHIALYKYMQHLY